MALAQGTPVLLLDEPTTFLDLAHQCEVMDLLQHLNATDGRTIVAVLHDLNQACRYAHHLIAIKDGAVVATGPPAAVVTEAIGCRRVRFGGACHRRPHHRHSTRAATRARPPDVTARRRPCCSSPGWWRQSVVLMFVTLLSIAYGSKPIPIGTVFKAFTEFDGSNEQLIVRSLRVPRTAVGLMVGACLGLSGAIMQGLTRNPLADPGILGVDAGAALAVVIAIYVFGVSSLLGYVWFSYAGALVASVVVYGLGSGGRTGATPVKIALAGAALSALLGSFTSAILLLDTATLDQFRFWSVGSIAGRDGDIARQVAPFVVVAVALSLCMWKALDTLALGDDVARSLGASVGAPVRCARSRSCSPRAPPPLRADLSRSSVS